MEDATAFVMTHEPDPGRKEKGLSVQALSVTRSLGRHGIQVVRVHPNHLDSGLESRYCKAVEVCPNMYGAEQELLTFLEAMARRYPGRRVLIPASDDCALFVSLHWERLRESFRLPSPNGSVMETIIDKRRQYEAAERLGVPIPETHFPRDLDQVRALAGRLENYPYVIKPVVAHRWRLSSMQRVSGGKKGIRVENADDLLREYRNLGAQAEGVMLQEVVQGRDERLFTFLTYFDERSRPLGYCIRSKLRQFPVDFGYCTLTVSCEEPRVQELSLRLLEGIGYHGIAGVEWKQDPRTGKYKLIEINARAVNTIAIAPACGVDVPYIAFMDAIDEPLPPMFQWRSGVKWTRANQDLWAARALHRQGRLTLREWWRSLRGKKVHAVFARDDWKPFLSDLGVFLRQQARRRRAKLGGARTVAST